MKKCIHSIWFLFVLSLAIQLPTAKYSTAQVKYPFQHFDTSDGLASISFGSLIQDTLGHIWIKGKPGTLSRFDGYSFKTYKYSPQDTLRYPGTGLIEGLLKDHSGNIWVTTPNSAFYRYDKAKDIFIWHKPKIKGELRRAYFDKKEPLLWIATRGNGLWQYNLKTHEVTGYLNTHADSVTHHNRNYINAITDYDSALLLATHQGLWLFDKASEKFYRPKVNPRDSSFLYNTLTNTIMGPGGGSGGGEDFIDDLIWIACPFAREIIRMNSRFEIVYRFK